jgi:hypothetical protein
MRIDQCTSSPVATSDTAVAAFAASRSSRVGITLTTKDGDKVTISSSETSTVAGGGVSDGRTTAAALVSSTSSSFSMSVEGELDRDELKDLKKALKVLRQAARHHDAEWLQRRLAKPDLDTLASVSAFSEETVTVIGGVMTLTGTAAPSQASLTAPSSEAAQ